MKIDLIEHKMLSRFNIRPNPPLVIPTLWSIANSRERERTLVEIVLMTLVNPINVSMMIKP